MPIRRIITLVLWEGNRELREAARGWVLDPRPRRDYIPRLALLPPSHPLRNG